MIEEEYLTALDEPLLLMQGFKYGYTGSTLWKKGRDGMDYACDTDSMGRYLKWYKTGTQQPLGESFSMTLKDFREQFCMRLDEVQHVLTG